jgi:hypothetical protein
MEIHVLHASVAIAVGRGHMTNERGLLRAVRLDAEGFRLSNEIRDGARRHFLHCLSTVDLQVISLRRISEAICLFIRPFTTKTITSFSLGVSDL